MTKRKKGYSRAESQNQFSNCIKINLLGLGFDWKGGEYIEPDILASALRDHGSLPLPPEILEYVCQRLQGKISKPRGRKAFPEFEKRRRRMLVRGLYRRYLAWLQARKVRYGHIDGWPSSGKPNFWQGTPGECAARMVACRLLYGIESWHTVQNMACSRE